MLLKTKNIQIDGKWTKSSVVQQKTGEKRIYLLKVTVGGKWKW